jgi:putative MATE family efflux protein
MSSDNNSKNFTSLGTDPIPKLVFRYVSAAIIAVIATTLTQMIDEAFLGRMAQGSSLAVAGLGVLNPMVVLVTGIGTAIGTGGTAYVGMRFGEHNHKKALRAIGNVVFISLLFTVFFMGLIAIMGDKLLTALGATPDILPFSRDYLSVYTIGIFFVIVANALGYLLNAVGLPGLRMFGLIMMGGINLILDPIFIFKLDMGISGAALSNIISAMVAVLFFAVVMIKRIRPLGFSIKDLIPDKKVIGGIMRLCVATYAAFVTEALMNAVFMRSSSALGDEFASLSTTFALLFQMAFLFILGISQSAEAISSYNYGNKKYGRARQTLLITMVLCLSLSILLELVFQFFPRAVISTILTETEVIEKGITLFRIYSSGFIFASFLMVLQVMFPSLNRVYPAVIVLVIRKLVLIVPLLLILPRYLGATGVYISETIGDFITGTIALLLLISQLKRLKKLEISENNRLEEEEEPNGTQ